MENVFNHFDEQGNAIMVDVTDKKVTSRKAIAEGAIKVSPDVMDAVLNHHAAKGDVLGVARIGGIMGAKRTAFLIPLCHPLALGHVSVDFELDKEKCLIIARCTAKIDGKTGVEMEALTGVTTALLTVYDMCKAIDKGMELQHIHLVHKEGGKSGNYDRPEANQIG
jgi:cyclic pyranopterin phosphate synthase